MDAGDRKPGGGEDFRTLGSLLNDLSGDVSVSCSKSVTSENLTTSCLPLSHAKQWSISPIPFGRHPDRRFTVAMFAEGVAVFVV
jgi:hypothetical protein